MRQVLQNLKKGTIEVAKVPSPRPKHGHLLISTHTTLLSTGTERMLTEFGKANLIEKARLHPYKVRMVLDKMKTDGLFSTVQAVWNRLDQPMCLGYSNVGTAVDTDGKPGFQGERVFKPGDRVVSNGPHAECVCVPTMLCARVPDVVSDEEAVFTVLGSIALEGVRLAQPTLGETFGVIGLGLIGLLTVQILRANGCRVIGVDLDSSRLDLARHFGAEPVNLKDGEDAIAAANAFSQGTGIDGVLITASTKSHDPVHQAAQMCRKRGRIVLVGIAGLQLSRDDFYKKELSFQVSCSYGPGRYDREYEEKGHDYPIGYVRWTEQRNFEAILNLMAEGRLDVKPLISHRFPIDEAERAYELLSGPDPHLGIILTYGNNNHGSAKRVPAGDFILDKPANAVRLLTPKCPTRKRFASRPLTIGFIGAGNFASRVLMPSFQKTGAALRAIAATSGVRAVHFGRQFGFDEATTDPERLLNDKGIDGVVIATPHNSHSGYVCEALKAGKHVFVEKPLCLSLEELERIESLYSSLLPNDPPPLLMVGFNRRFSPQIIKMKELLATTKEPKSLIMTINAGAIPPDHWTQDPEVGGGRILGEACHFVDLLRFLGGCEIERWETWALKGAERDTTTIQLAFKDGSIGTIHYFANGDHKFPKERLEVFCGGKILQLNNFRKLHGYGWPKFSRMHLWKQDKGHQREVNEFVKAVLNGGPCPIPFEEIVEVTRVILELVNRRESGCCLA